MSDHEKDVESLIKAVAENGADYVVADVLNFRGETRTRYLSFLQTYDPTLIPKYEALYPTNYCDHIYARKIRHHTNKIIKKFEVNQYNKMYSFRRS
jgi:DNA repair photolyase